MRMAHVAATVSKDRSRRIGAVVVGPDDEVRSTGTNGFPRGIDDDVEARHRAPEKYAWTEHAERNAIYNAARIGVSTAGCTLYATAFPCMDCARAIVQSGIALIVTPGPPEDDSTFDAHYPRVTRMLTEAGVRLVRWEDDDG